MDLFLFDYYAHAPRPVAEVREVLGIPPKSDRAIEGGSADVFDLAGMSDAQRRRAEQLAGGQ